MHVFGACVLYVFLPISIVFASVKEGEQARENTKRTPREHQERASARQRARSRERASERKRRSGG